MDFIIKALAAVGAITLIHFAQTAYQFFTFHLIAPTNPLSSYKRTPINNDSDDAKDPQNQTTWALVTGSSAGIGLGTAQELVRQGFGVILHGHLPDELAQAKDTLLALSSPSPAGPQVKVLVLDARTATPEEMQSAVESISHLQVSILVNNVGGNPVHEPNFLEIKDLTCEDVDAVINQNARFMSRLTTLMLPLLRKKTSPGDKSLIINLASPGMYGMPWMVMYGATKGFNWSFSVGLRRELKANPGTEHIDCVCVIPGEVLSQGNCAGVPKAAPRWDQFGREMVWKVDGAVKRGWWEMKPHMRHGAQLGLLGMLPWDVADREITEASRKKRDAWRVLKGVKEE